MQILGPACRPLPSSTGDPTALGNQGWEGGGGPGVTGLTGGLAECQVPFLSVLRASAHLLLITTPRDR